jgi:hypothetical protein
MWDITEGFEFSRYEIEGGIGIEYCIEEWMYFFSRVKAV